jgi:hypothetical protein
MAIMQKRIPDCRLTRAALAALHKITQFGRMTIHEFVFLRLYYAAKSVVCLCGVYARARIGELPQRKIAGDFLSCRAKNYSLPARAFFVVELWLDAPAA